MLFRSSTGEMTQQPIPRGYHRSNSTPSDAAALFSKPITTTETTDVTPIAQPDAVDSTPTQQHPEPQQPDLSQTDTTLAADNATGVTNAEDYDDLDDVPLTPGQDMTTKVNVIENDAYQHAPGGGNEPPQPPLSNPVNSLIAAIGMPPPPFSRK